MRRLTQLSITTLSACFVLWAASAGAQTRPAPAGPLVLEPSSDGPVLAPEVKFTNFEHGGSGTIVGGYGGWLVDNKLLLGGGVDFLVDHGYHDRVAGLGYGGFVAGYYVPAGKALRAGVRALVGFGQAELTDTFTFNRYPMHPDPHHPEWNPAAASGMNTVPTGPYTAQYRTWQDFFIFEPQGNALIRLSRAVALDVAGGYRLTAGAGHYDSWLRGASGSIGVRIGPKL